MAHEIDFIGIGAPRSGTSWIANALRSHSGICISEPKEIRYFNRHEMPVGRLKGRLNPNFDNDIDWYLKRFAHGNSGQLRGEISPVYLSDSRAASAIAGRYPHVKLIACLRNPVSQAFSFYKLHRGNSIIDDISFDTALEQESVYVDTNLYGSHLNRYLEYFNRDQLLVLVFEELIANPIEEFRRIFDFLGVSQPAEFDPSNFHTNESASRRSNKLHKFAFRFSQWLIEAGLSSVLEGLRSVGAHKVLHRVNRAPMQKETMSDSARAKLTDAFREDILLLERTFELDLEQWK